MGGSIVQIEALGRRAVPVTIANATSLSAVVDLEGYDLIGIEVPSGFTGTAITFQAAEAPSTSGSGGAQGTFQNVYNSGGTEVSVTVAASRCVVFTAAHAAALQGLRYLKVRSGSSASPVNQTADATLQLLRRQGA